MVCLLSECSLQCSVAENHRGLVETSHDTNSYYQRDSPAVSGRDAVSYQANQNLEESVCHCKSCFL